MHVIIDGYNLLHESDIFAGEGPGTELHRARLALLDFLATAIDARHRTQTTIVFDAAGAGRTVAAASGAAGTETSVTSAWNR